MIHTGDCIQVMAGMEPDSVDAIVTDPPYGLEFMGKEWDRFGVGSTAAGETSSGWKPPSDSTPGQDGPGGEQVPGGNPAARPKLDVRQPGDPTFHKSGAGPFDRATVRHGFYSGKTLPALLTFQSWCQQWGSAALRVTRPGGYLLSFGGTRTHHRLVCGLEDAGWIIRDELDWIYASGFPKGKANLKPAHEPIVLARKPGPLQPLGIDAGRIPSDVDRSRNNHARTDGSSYIVQREDAVIDPGGNGRWPSNVLLQDAELFDAPNPEVVGSGAVTSVAWTRPSSGVRDATGYDFGPKDGESGPFYGDTGGYSRFFTLSVRMDGCQYCGAPAAASSSAGNEIPAIPSGSTPASARTNGSAGTGRHAPSAASESTDSITPTARQNARLWDDEGSGSSSERPPTSNSGIASSSGPEPTTRRTPRSKLPATSPRSASPSGPATSAVAPATSSATTTTTPVRWTCDACAALVTRASTLGGMSTGAEDYPEVPASRPDYPRFLIIPKADRADREPVLRGQVSSGRAEHTYGDGLNTATKVRTNAQAVNGVQRALRENGHPTVKPVDLMRHLVRLVTPTGGTVLDPFLGSGSTAIAATLEGFKWIGIEKEPEYVAIAEARLNGTQQGLGLDVAAPTRKAPKTHPDLSKHQPKQRAASENYSGSWVGTIEDEPDGTQRGMAL